MHPRDKQRPFVWLCSAVIALFLWGSASAQNLFGSIKDNNHFSDPDHALSPTQVGDFQLGNAFFRKLWATGSASVESADGVGPLFNSRSCQRCHLKDGRGNPPVDSESLSPSLVFQLNGDPKINEGADKTYGKQIQPFAANGLHGEGLIFVRFSQEEFTYPDGQTTTLNRPTYRVEQLNYGKLESTTALSPRIAPSMIGLGLLEALPETLITSIADPDDVDNDGISGRANYGYSLAQQKTMLGRFGWKASAPTVVDQSAVAFSVDMGLSTPYLLTHHGDCTAAQTACIKLAQFHAGDDPEPEISQDTLNLVAFYSANLAVPKSRNQSDSRFKQGEHLFSDIGCAACHTPKLMTGNDETTEPHLRNREIQPYTDLLLHDMGEDLADFYPQGFASASEWRTAPLWGIGLTQAVNPKARFLHDGRAATIEEAILWHGGEAHGSKLKFIELSANDRAALLFFLESL